MTPLSVLRMGLLILVVAGAGAASASAQVVQRLDFETRSLNQWSGSQAAAGRVRVVRTPRRQGRFAARFLIRRGDRPNDHASRAELYANTGERSGTESWWTWSTRFPRAFRAQRGTWNLFTQWHGTVPLCIPNVAFLVDRRTRRPKLLLGVSGGAKSMATCKGGTGRGWRLARLQRGRWYDFVFHVKWSASSSAGFVELWLNRRRVVPLTHLATLYVGQGAYVKQGFYSGPRRINSLIFHDGLRRHRGRPAWLR
jgi:polysaccharide lyase-like protein